MAPIHSTINPAKHEIRLLRLLDKHSTAGKIACCLEVATLDDEKPFEALSYCWGSPVDPVAITVNDQELDVTQNLAAALRHLLNTGDARNIPIWIDAICINQTDVEERSSQVAMMGDLYQKAAKVHIWLGGSEVVREAAMRALEKFTSVPVQNMNLSSRGPWQMRNLTEADIPMFRDLAELAQLDYWKRTWILQEISIKPRLVVHGADQRIELHVEEPSRSVCVWLFNRLPSRDRGNYERAAWTEEIFKYATTISSAFEPMAMADWMTIASRLITAGQICFARVPQEMLHRFRHALATDPRDKIYGLLGLLPGVLHVTPNYNRSTEDVYQEATIQLMDFSKDLEVLIQACSNNPRLPSWVPDFAVPSRMPKYLVDHLKGCFAGADAPYSRSTTENGAICVKGFELGTVAEIERGIEDPPEQEDANFKTLRCLQRWQRLFSKYVPFAENMDPTSRQQVYWRAVCGGLMYHVTLNESRSVDSIGIQNLVDRGLVTTSSLEKDFLVHLTKVVRDNDFFMTSQDFAGLVPKHSTATGDGILILAGSATPFCARSGREINGSIEYSLRAPCFVENEVVEDERSDRKIMYGAAMIARRGRASQAGDNHHSYLDDIYLV